MIICDKCNKEIVIELKEKKLKDDVKKVYFNCNSCNKEYLIYLSNKEIEKKQHELQKLMIEANREELSTEDKQMYYKRYKALKNEIKADMEALEEKYKESL